MKGWKKGLGREVSVIVFVRSVSWRWECGGSGKFVDGRDREREKWWIFVIVGGGWRREQACDS